MAAKGTIGFRSKGSIVCARTQWNFWFAAVRLGVLCVINGVWSLLAYNRKLVTPSTTCRTSEVLASGIRGINNLLVSRIFYGAAGSSINHLQIKAIASAATWNYKILILFSDCKMITLKTLTDCTASKARIICSIIFITISTKTTASDRWITKWG